MVLLVHGLWMNRFVMAGIAAMLKRRGHAVELWGYPTTTQSLDENAGALARVIDRLGGADIVAHSYGGVVALRMLERTGPHHTRRVVLLGSPIAGCRAGVGMASVDAGRKLLGLTAGIWQAPAVRIIDGFEVGAIAGTRPRGLGRILTRLPAPNDGVVCLDETRLPGLADHVPLAVSHSGMLASPLVARYADGFLRHGHFPQ